MFPEEKIMGQIRPFAACHNVVRGNEGLLMPS